MSTLERAIEMAANAHAGQVDKGGQPYILHPLRVMLKMDTDEERIVAVLHDVMEDSDIDLSDLEKERFTNKILTALVALTKLQDSYDDYIVEVRKNDLARKVKLSDLEENMDMTRIPKLSHKDFERYKKYVKATLFLGGTLN